MEKVKVYIISSTIVREIVHSTNEMVQGSTRKLHVTMNASCGGVALLVLLQWRSYVFLTTW